MAKRTGCERALRCLKASLRLQHLETGEFPHLAYAFLRFCVRTSLTTLVQDGANTPAAAQRRAVRLPHDPRPMRLTRYTDNALRCLLYLAALPSRTATVSEVAARMAMSPDHLLKVIQRLVSLGYVRTIRGRNGGVQLAKDPYAITIGEVVRATEPTLAIVPCFDSCGTACPLNGSCELAGAFEESLRAFFAVLEHRTVAELAAGSKGGLARSLETLTRADATKATR